MALLAAIVALGNLPALRAADSPVTDFPVTDFGATVDDTTLDTAAIQKAIDTAYEKGGGRVVLPKGTVRSGSIFLKQNVELHIPADAVLLGSDNIADYPKRRTRIEGHFPEWRLALINAQNLTGVRITGSGKIDGNGSVFWAAFWQRRKENANCTNLEVERPRLFLIDTCNDVRIEGLTLRDSGFWNVHLYRCRDVVLEGLDIASPIHGAPSTDGIDIDSCQNVTIRRCKISVGDDCIAIKGTKGPLALQDESSPPVENILIEDCEFGSGHGVLTLGSEATVVRNVTIRNCKIRGENKVVRLKLRPDTPQLYENLTFENLTLDSPRGRLFDVQPWTQFFDLKGHPLQPSVVKNVTIRNITGNFGSLGILNPSAIDTVDGITMENITLTVTDEKFELGEGVKNLVSKNVTINGKPFVAPTPIPARKGGW
ncbi:MAG: glycosyl hydrolase family 28 protein [Terrimicrobiaceae bacterium]